MNTSRGWTRVCGIGLLFGLVGPLEAQPDSVAASPLLLRRLASFADDFRTGELIFVVAGIRPPHHIDPTPFATRGDAQAAASRYGAGYAVFGPFRTPRDAAAPTRPITWTRITLIGLDGADSIRRDIDPRAVDAIVFSMSAYDRYFHPYNRTVWGDSVAGEMRSAAMVVRGLKCHLKIFLYSTSCEDVKNFPGVRPFFDPLPIPPWTPADMIKPPL